MKKKVANYLYLTMLILISVTAFFVITTLFTSCDVATDPNYLIENTFYEAKITATVDGDTVKIMFTDIVPKGCEQRETVRLIGVDTPELYTTPPEYYAEEARDYLNQWYAQTIYLRFDTVSAMRDKYGRLLAYVYDDKNAMSINQRLIEEGYGYYYGIFTFDSHMMWDFEESEKWAKAKKLGLWE